MTDRLREEVEKGGRQLLDIWRILSSRPSNTTLPTKCYERWEAMARLHSGLNGSVPLLEVRKNAWKLICSLVDSDRIAREEEREELSMSSPTEPSPNFSHDGVLMDFREARHLTLTSYMTVTWSIYDRLANVCGRLAATESVHGNPRRNPKLCEDLLAKKKEKGSQPHDQEGYGHQLFAFSMQHHLVNAYAWPAKVSYTLRNWLVHEGYTVGSTHIFKSDRVDDRLLLHPEAITHIERACDFSDDGNGDPSCCCVRGDENPWKPGQDKDLLSVLEKYHAEIDMMFVGLVKWSVASFADQVIAFTERDETALKSAVIKKTK